MVHSEVEQAAPPHTSPFLGRSRPLVSLEEFVFFFIVKQFRLDLVVSISVLLVWLKFKFGLIDVLLWEKPLYVFVDFQDSMRSEMDG